MFQALAAAGVASEQADDPVSQMEAGVVGGAHTWISESSALHGSAPGFNDGWFEGIRAVANDLLYIVAQRKRPRPTPSKAHRKPHLSCAFVFD